MYSKISDLLLHASNISGVTISIYQHVDLLTSRIYIEYYTSFR